MAVLKSTFKRIVLSIVTISILITFFAMPSSMAKLDLEEGDFYYSGTQEGTYVVSEGILSKLWNALAELAEWLIGILTMGPRMVFVGWTALFEKLLTWALESSTGVNLNGQLVESATDMTSITDSSNNVTVEAIVYNMVPALNINFFDDVIDPTVGGTGQKLICDDCEKPVDECCGDTGVCDASCNCIDVDENGKTTRCHACEAYKATLAGKDSSVIYIIREQLGKWYYIMRLLAVAVMLVLLIAIGVKMAISTVASEKALYKRMFIDWVVGMIILFSIHFMMLFMIRINESLVNMVHETANKLNAEQMEELNLMTLSEEKGKANYSNQELEVKVYEEIRTRAYDIRLTIGLPGMIMYMALVYFAVRYTIVYVKRYLTIMVLTLMGPGIGVSYAFQKVFHGKAASYGTWLKEYILNIIIQTVHAILYSVFVSQALILALDSVSGMIIALVFLNFTLKADKTFRKIFNMNGNLFKGTADAGDAENMRQPLNAFNTFLKADATKQIGKTLMHTPLAGVTKGIGKAAVAGGAAAATGLALGASKIGSRRKNEDDEGNEGEEKPTLRDKMGDLGDGVLSLAAKLENNKLGRAVNRINTLPIRAIAAARNKNWSKYGKNNLRGKSLEEIKDAVHAAPDNKKQMYQEAFDRAVAENKDKHTIKQPSTIKVLGSTLKRTIDVRNTFDHKGGFSLGGKAVAAWRGVFGRKDIDPKTGKTIHVDGLYSKFAPANLFNLSQKDIREFKELWKQGSGGLIGIGMMGVGMMTAVGSPKIGLPLLTGGFYKTNQAFGRANPTIKGYRRHGVDYSSGRYTFSAFSAGAIKTMGENVKERAEDEVIRLGQLDVSGTESSLRNLDIRVSNAESEASYEKVKEAGKDAATRTSGEQETAKPKIYTEEDMQKMIADSYQVTAEARGTRKRHPITKFGAKFDKVMQRIEEDAAEDFEGQEIAVYDEFTGEYITVDGETAQVLKDYNSLVKSFEASVEEAENAQLMVQFGRLKRKLDNQTTVEETGEIDAKTKAETLDAELESSGFRSDEDVLGIETRKSVSITEEDRKFINAEINSAIEQVANGGEIDLNNKKTMNQVLKMVSDKAAVKGVIGEKAKIDDLFARGSLEQVVKNKMTKYNSAATKADTAARAVITATAPKTGSGSSKSGKRKGKLDQIVASGIEEYERQEKGNILADILSEAETVAEGGGGSITLPDGTEVQLSATEASLVKESMGLVLEMASRNRKANKNNKHMHQDIGSITEDLLRQKQEMGGDGSSTVTDPRLISAISDYRKSEDRKQRRNDIDGEVYNLGSLVDTAAGAAAANERKAKRAAEIMQQAKEKAAQAEAAKAAQKGRKGKKR